MQGPDHTVPHEQLFFVRVPVLVVGVCLPDAERSAFNQLYAFVLCKTHHYSKLRFKVMVADQLKCPTQKNLGTVKSHHLLEYWY